MENFEENKVTDGVVAPDAVPSPGEDVRPDTAPIAETVTEGVTPEAAPVAENVAQDVTPEMAQEPLSEELPVQEGAADLQSSPTEGEPAPAFWGMPVPVGDPVPVDGGNTKKSLGLFFAIFGSVVGVFALLLFLTLLLGKDGIRITKTVNYDRTVYVREDGTVVGTYTRGEVVDLLKPSTVTVLVKGSGVNGFGSGFVYTADGYIITNHHVIAANGNVQVMLDDGKVYDATVVGSNEAADVAVVKIEADRPLTPVKMGNSATVLVGESVAAIGTPVELGYQGTATFGQISATTRIVTFTDSSGSVTKRMYVMQTDTSVNPGNSGGPLVNMDGEVIGVVVMKLMGNSQEYYEGLGFALPINGVEEIADEIIENGSFTGTNPIAKGRLLLGIMGHTVTEGYWYKIGENGSIEISMSEVEGYTQMPASGVHVISAQEDGGAVGILQKGDIIIKADGMRVVSIEDLIGTVNRRESGYGVVLTVLRNGTEMDLTVNLREEPLQ